MIVILIVVACTVGGVMFLLALLGAGAAMNGWEAQRSRTPGSRTPGSRGPELADATVLGVQRLPAQYDAAQPVLSGRR